MLKQYKPFHCSGVLYLMRPSGAVSLTYPPFGGSLNILVSITSPDLISLLCFPVQLQSISLTVGNSDSYINLLNTHTAERMQGKESTTLFISQFIKLPCRAYNQTNIHSQTLKVCNCIQKEMKFVEAGKHNYQQSNHCLS